MSQRTREIERAYFEGFRRAHGEPAGVVSFGDKPDVIVRGERTVGVEVTQLYLTDGGDPASEQRQRPLREAVVAEAQRLFATSGGAAIEWHVGFRPGALVAGQTKRVARALANFALRLEPEAEGQVWRDRYQVELPELVFLYVNRTPYADARWRVSQVHGVDLMSPSAVQAVIDEKAAKASAYASCDALWLLIVVEPMDAAQEQEIQLDSLRAQSSVFERVIVYRPTFEHVVEADLGR